MRLHELERQYDIHFEGHSVIGGFIHRGSRIGALAGRYVFGELSRLFNFPSGPHNFGKLLSLSEQPAQGGLHRIFELQGFHEAMEELGLTDPEQEPRPFPPTPAVLGIGQDASDTTASGLLGGAEREGSRRCPTPGTEPLRLGYASAFRLTVR